MKKTVLLFALALLGLSVTALEWPVTDFNPLRFFGQRSEGVIERGITIDNADIVRAAGHGRVLVTLEQNGNMSGFPGTLGNAVILAHDDGLITVYGNLGSLDRIGDMVQIESQTILAQTGTAGWGKPHNFVFQVVDQLKKTALNPLLLLPSLKDSCGPSIKNVIVVSRNNQSSPLGSVKSVRQGKYRLYADVSDTIDGSSHELSPFRISVLINGSEYSSVPFELLREEKGQLFLSSPDYSWMNLYSDPSRLYLGEIALTRGRADISIIARDIAGNERSVMFGLQIE